MAKPYIVIVTDKNGKQTVTDHQSKAAAHKAGQAARRQGLSAFAHSAADAKKFGLDPRAKSGGAPAKRKAVTLKLLKGGKQGAVVAGKGGGGGGA